MSPNSAKNVQSVSACVCVCERERERWREIEKEREKEHFKVDIQIYFTSQVHIIINQNWSLKPLVRLTHNEYYN